jgi:acetyl-CoA carboxylase carboxyltransferase component
MSWQNEVDGLRRREEMARRMGGPDKIRRQRDGSKLTVRERIDRLLDRASFRKSPRR